LFTLGADPEIFLGRGGRFVNAYGLIPGTKEEPHRVIGGAVQVDGVAVEFNIDPVTDLNNFRYRLDLVTQQLRQMLPGYQFLKAVTVNVDPKHFANMPEEALLIGCNSDVNAYTAEDNPTPVPQDGLRAVGGHLHIGGFFEEGQKEMSRYIDSLRLARLLDKYVGVYSLLWDSDTRRRQIYGAAGACRVKDYGVEYRSLSNSWLFRPKVVGFLYHQIGKAVEALKQGEDVDSLYYAEIINKSWADHEFFARDPTALRLKGL
jgi:hypothetical protein